MNSLLQAAVHALAAGNALPIADGANIQIYSANGSAAQTFSFVSTAPSVEPCDDILPEGWHTIGISSNPSYVLDVASGSKENGANVQLYAGNGSLAQLYRFDYRDGYYTIVSACSGKALDVEDRAGADVEAVHSAAAAPIAPTSIAPDIPTLSQPLSVPKAQAPKAHGTTVPADPYGRPEQRVPMTSLRARIAERLLASQQQSAQLTTFNEVDLSAVMALRARYKEKFEKKYGIKLGFMSFFVKAAVYALRKFPVLNASIDGRDVIYHGYIDVGVAVGTERGLVVPVIRNADQKSFAEIEIEIADYAKRAASGKLKLEEITGGTFTVSNGGVFGSLMSTPIINPPQSAILGIHATRERPVVVDHQIVIRPMNYFALSYDHRLIDGREAVLGLMAMKEALEDPARILLDI